MKATFSIPGLKYFLKNSVSAETSVNPMKWSKENPFYGHCAVIALVVQDELGGKILRGELSEEWRKKLGYSSHYWNILADGKIVDFSKEQFPKDFPYEIFIKANNNKDYREYVLSFPETRKRYEVLLKRFKNFVNSNPIFTNEIFHKCWEVAFSESKCLKMKFGAVVYDKNKLIASCSNRLMTEQFGKSRFCSLDGSSCARMNIQSRMDATIGDCGHAPIWCLKQVFDMGYKPSDLPKLDFYEAGFYPDGTPWMRKEASYTCAYCENIFAIFGLDKIWGVVDGTEWVKLWTKDSFYSSAQYALGKAKL